MEPALQISQRPVAMPLIPQEFLDHPRIGMVLAHTISDFDFEEQRAIYFYGLTDLPLSEIAATAQMTPAHTQSALTLYAERLKSKVELFQKAVPYNKKGLVPVSKLLLLDRWNEITER